MSVRLSNFLCPTSLSVSGSNETSSSYNNKLSTCKIAAVSIGLLATGVFLAASYYSSDNVDVDENIAQTSIATQITSLTQDVVLFVSGGIMPALGLLGMANHVFK
ncbi:MAG: hypothetical protein K2X08_06805 [Chlamydiales bacterium]|nr:hypothetical protein [Chlamydiales bacterium]